MCVCVWRDRGGGMRTKVPTTYKERIMSYHIYMMPIPFHNGLQKVVPVETRVMDTLNTRWGRNRTSTIVGFCVPREP